MKRFAAFGLMILGFGCFSKTIVAQSCLTIEKELVIKDNTSINATLNAFILDLIEATDGTVIYSSNNNQVAIIKGQMPLVLSTSWDELAARFNGQVNYQLTIACQKDKVVLTFTDLSHHANESINGFDFDYGLLQTNNATQKKAVFYNYDFLKEDYQRLHRFSADDKIASLIHAETRQEIDQLIALAAQ